MSSGCASSTAAANSALKLASASAATRASFSAAGDSCARRRSTRAPTVVGCGSRPPAPVAHAREHQVLQGLQREHRIAAGVPEQCRRQAPGIDRTRPGQRVDQSASRAPSRGWSGTDSRRRVSSSATPRRGRRAAVGRPLREAPVHVDKASDCISDCMNSTLASSAKCRSSTITACQPERDRAGQRGVDRAEQQQALGLPGQRRGAAEFRQQQRQLLAPRVTQAHALARQHGAQQTRQQRVGDAGVARTRLNADDAVVAAAKSCSRRVLPMPASPISAKMRRPDQACASIAAFSGSRPISRGGCIRLAGHDRPARGQGRRTALDGREQLDRLRRWAGAEFVLQALLETLERGDRRRCGHRAGSAGASDGAARARPAGRSPPGAGHRPGRATIAPSPRTRPRPPRAQRRAARASVWRCRDPLGQLGELVEVEITEQLVEAGVSRRTPMRARLGARSVCSPPTAAARGRWPSVRRTSLTAQPEQALAQIGVGLAASTRPARAASGTVGRDRAIERDQASKRCVLGRQADSPLAENQARRTEQAQLEAGQRAAARRSGVVGAGHAARSVGPPAAAGNISRERPNRPVRSGIGALPLLHGYRRAAQATRQTLSMLVPPGWPIGSPQVMA